MVMVTVAFIAFMLFQYVGDPVVFLLGQDATPRADSQSCAPIWGWTSPFLCSSGTFW
jgi:peptide/nickel transport system permease protein